MTIMDRHLARAFLLTLLKVTVSLVLLVVLIDFLTRQQSKIGRYDFPIHVLGTYYLTFVPTILFSYQVAAMAVLVSGLMVFGRAAQNNEVTALLAGGVGLWRLARAPILLALCAAFAAFGIEETLGTRAAALADRIEREHFRRFEADSSTGVSWTRLGDGWTCHTLAFNRAALTGQDVYLHRSEGRVWEHIEANRIYWDPDARAWVLEDGWRLRFDAEKVEELKERITQARAPFTEPPEMLFALDQPSEGKSVGVLAADLRRAERLGIPTGRHWVDYHARFARPALCFVMVLLAIPFAIRLRRGGVAIGFGLSLAVGLAYITLFYVCLGLGTIGKLSPLAAAWLPTALFLAAGVVLCRRTPT